MYTAFGKHDPAHFLVKWVFLFLFSKKNQLLYPWWQ